MLIKSSSQDSLGQFQPNMVGNMLGRWEFRFLQIKVLAPFGEREKETETKRLYVQSTQIGYIRTSKAWGKGKY